MADENPSAGNTTEKPVVVVRTSFGAGNTGGSGTGSEGRRRSSSKREEDRSESSVSASASAGVSVVSSNPSTPTRNKAPAGGSSNIPNKERRYKEGHQQNRRNSGREKRTPSTSTAVPSTSEGITAATTAAGGGSGQSSKKNKRFQVKKRTPPKEDIEIKPNDVFVNEKSNFLAQLGKCKRIFEKGHQEIYLHGLGKAIPRAINLAFELKKFYHNTVDYAVNTSTIELFDDVIDLENPEQNPTVRARKVSSVDIKVYRCINIP